MSAADLFNDAAALRSKATQYRSLAERYERAAELIAPLEEAKRRHKVRGTAALRPIAQPVSKKAGKRGRPKGTGTRDKQAVAIVTEHPGVTLHEIARRMGINPNYLYRVMPKLVAAGAVDRDDQHYYPASNGTS